MRLKPPPDRTRARPADSAAPPERLLGMFRRGPRDNRIVPNDRRVKGEWIVPPGHEAGAEANEIVLAQPLPPRRSGPPMARVIERLGPMRAAGSVSRIAIAGHDIPHRFAADALAEADTAGPPAPGDREDLRRLPLVTIDGPDARDFDDAVFAEPHPTGFRLIVAIADVAHYVRPDTALDAAAMQRGNSVYFPDRVVPMLPEKLSDGWCSLRPDEDRACLFVELHLDAAGHKRTHRFARGLIRSAARLTYEQVQAAHDRGETLGLPLPALYAAFRVLLAARQARGALDLDLPERQVVLDGAGGVRAVLPRPRLDSHRLIEEIMILANVAAAEELERHHAPCLYRVHPPPSIDKLQDLRTILRGFRIPLPPADRLRTADLDGVLRRAAATADAAVINEAVLRSQSPAAYSPRNSGHFGLALPRYTHFTSPIRRYADLLVHRALIGALRLGQNGLKPAVLPRLEILAEQLTAAERRAQTAERDATDRYLASFMADRVGSVFAARISGVARFGLFVTVAENGAGGIVPRAALPDDLWQHDERAQTLTGRRTRLVFRPGQDVEVRLAEADVLTGSLAFQLMQGIPARTPARARQSGKRSRFR